MRNLKFYTVALLCLSMLLPSCSMSNQGKGGLIGAGGGAALGGIIGNLIGKDTKGTLIGAAIGTAVGATTGAIIGKKMDKQAEELAKIDGAQVASVTDANNLQAIKVTFDSGILFQTGKSDLSASSLTSLSKFARSLIENPDTDVKIYGHTDNTGSRAINETLSAQRAQAVANNLISKGVNESRITTKGMAYDDPVADNSTVAGRALNRRVEIYITADKNMIEKAENGQLR